MPSRSIILQAVVALLFFLVNVFAIYLLLRGHNLPGGGFIGGLGSALSFILFSLAFGIQSVQRIMRIDPTRIAAAGLALAALSALAPVAAGDAFLTQYNWKFVALPVIGDLALGTPLSFDLGVFLVVVGVTCKMIFVLARSAEGLPALDADETERYASTVEEGIEAEHAPTDAEEAAR